MKIITANVRDISTGEIRTLQEGIRSDVLTWFGSCSLTEEQASDMYNNLTKNYIGTYKYHFADKAKMKNKITNCGKLLKKLSDSAKSDKVVIGNLDDIVFVYNGIDGVNKISVDDDDRVTASDLLTLAKAVDDISYVFDVYAAEEAKLAKDYMNLAANKMDNATELERLIDKSQKFGVNRLKIDTFLDSLVSLATELIAA